MASRSHSSPRRAARSSTTRIARIAMVPAEGGRRPCSPRLSTKIRTCSTGARTESYFAALQKTNAHIFRLDPATRQMHAHQRPGPVSPGRRFVHARSPHARGNRRGAEPFRRGFGLTGGRFRAALPHRHGRPVEGFPTRHSGSDPVEVGRRNRHRRHADQARRLRCCRESTRCWW